jgi:hypothetical protein
MATPGLWPRGILAAGLPMGEDSEATVIIGGATSVALVEDRGRGHA